MSGGDLLLPGGRLGTGGGVWSDLKSVSGRNKGAYVREVVPEGGGSFMRVWLTLRLSALNMLILEVSLVGIVEIEEPPSIVDSLVRPWRARLPGWWCLGFISENEGFLNIAVFEWEDGRAWAGLVSRG